MATALEAATTAINKAAEAFATPTGRRRRSEWRQPYAAGLRFALLDVVDDGDWQELSRLAANVRRDATDDLEQMSRQQAELRRMSASVEIIRSHVEPEWQAPKTLGAWQAKQDSFVDELVQKGMDRHRAVEAVLEFGEASGRDVVRTIEQPISAWGLELERCTAGRLAALSAADLSDAVAKFNRYAFAPDEEHVSVSETSSRVRRHFRELYDELKRDDDQALEDRAKAIDATVDQILEPLLRAAAFAAGPMLLSSDVERARAGSRVADVIRSCLLLRSAARVIAWTSGWGSGSAPIRKWRTAARDRRFASTFQMPQRTRLRDLAASPPADGEHVSVEGWMGPITDYPSGKKGAIDGDDDRPRRTHPSNRPPVYQARLWWHRREHLRTLCRSVLSASRGLCRSSVRSSSTEPYAGQSPQLDGLVDAGLDASCDAGRA